MINKDCFTKPSHCYCDEPEKIENYDKAMADTEKVWICHHRLESCFTVEFLKKMGLYFHQPAEALVFVENEKEHQSYKHAGHKNSHKAISTFWKGKKLSKEHIEHRSEKRKTFLIKCIETGEIKYDCEWRKLGYGNARLVARGQRKTCKGLHFVQAEETK